MTRHTLHLLLAAAIACACGVAQASLGQNASPATARSMRAAPASTSSGAPFERHEFALPDGGSATEFLDSAGFVFAVKWSSPTMPDLSILLGAYKANLDAAQSAAQSQIRSPGAFASDNGELNIVSTGRLRAYKGHSHLKSKLPAGFDLLELEQ